MRMQEAKQYKDMIDIMPMLIRLNRALIQKGGLKENQPIPPAQLHALVFLSKFPTLSMTQLSNHLQMQRQQMTQIVEGLVKKGLVQRKADPSNRRLVLIELTDEGQEVLREFFVGNMGLFRQLLSLMDDEQREKFLTAIDMIKEVLTSLQV